MECLFGIVGDGFVLMVADMTAARSIAVNDTENDKIMILDSHKLLGAAGPEGDRVQFTEFVQKNVALYQHRNGIPLSTHAAAHYTRAELATALRSRGAYQTNLLVAGYDEGVGPSLFFLDYLATLHRLKHAAFGYCGYFLLAIFDKYYHVGMSVDEAVALADKCIAEIRLRLIVAPPNFVLKIVDKDGARELLRRRTIGPLLRGPADPAAAAAGEAGAAAVGVQA